MTAIMGLRQTVELLGGRQRRGAITARENSPPDDPPLAAPDEGDRLTDLEHVVHDLGARGDHRT